MNKPLLSLCIPTNGVVEWIFPVLDSIFCQGVDENLYEVVIVDNGDNQIFKEKIKNYIKEHSNIVYKESGNKGFLNEIDTYKTANGDFIKFINHRTMLCKGTLQYFIDFVTNNIEAKPFVYFSNGSFLSYKKESIPTFDGFVRRMSYWSSWSTGMAFWKEDFNKIPADEKYNELFPHTNILFSQRNKQEYIIDDTVLLEEMQVDQSKKGRYDLFYAFAIEFPSIILNLCRDGDITVETFNSVKKDNLLFLGMLYRDYIRKKKPCSYDLSSYKTSVAVFYSRFKVWKSSFSFLTRIKNKIKKKK